MRRLFSGAGVCCGERCRTTEDSRPCPGRWERDSLTTSKCMRSIDRRRDQSRSHGIMGDVFHRMAQGFLVLETMIKKSLLPTHADILGRPPFPRANGRCQIRRNGDEQMQMIRHHRGDMAPPAAVFVIERNRGKQTGCGVVCGERV